MVILALAVAGGLGAVLRWLTSTRLADRRAPRGTATTLVNLVGALALGVVVALWDGGHIDPHLGLVMGTGLLGAFTTFSTWMVETWEGSEGRAAAVFIRTTISTLAGVALTWLGIGVGDLLG